jgi:uncharacterized RDD family membrane protein YckC
MLADHDFQPIRKYSRASQRRVNPFPEERGFDHTRNTGYYEKGRSDANLRTSALTVNPAPQPHTRCSLGRRLLAMIYDAVIVTGLLLVAAALASPLDSGNQQALRDPVFTLYLAGVWYAYLAWCWQRGGMTLGMRAWRVRLRTDEGGPMDWRASSLRFGVSLISAACLGLGFAWSLFDRSRRCWHDMASGSGLYRINRS